MVKTAHLRRLVRVAELEPHTVNSVKVKANSDRLDTKERFYAEDLLFMVEGQVSLFQLRAELSDCCSILKQRGLAFGYQAY